jgi:hypothetical protein
MEIIYSVLIIMAASAAAFDLILVRKYKTAKTWKKLYYNQLYRDVTFIKHRELTSIIENAYNKNVRVGEEIDWPRITHEIVRGVTKRNDELSGGTNETK